MVAFWLYICGILVISSAANSQNKFISDNNDAIELLGILFWPFVISGVCIYFIFYNILYLIRGR